MLLLPWFSLVICLLSSSLRILSLVQPQCQLFDVMIAFDLSIWFHLPISVDASKLKTDQPQGHDLPEVKNREKGKS